MNYGPKKPHRNTGLKVLVACVIVLGALAVGYGICYYVQKPHVRDGLPMHPQPTTFWARVKNFFSPNKPPVVYSGAPRTGITATAGTTATTAGGGTKGNGGTVIKAK